MRELISGLVGTLWGGAVLVSWFMQRNEAGSGGSSAYGTGRSMALVFGGLLLAGGIYYLQKAIRARGSI